MRQAFLNKSFTDIFSVIWETSPTIEVKVKRLTEAGYVEITGSPLTLSKLAAGEYLFDHAFSVAGTYVVKFEEGTLNEVSSSITVGEWKPTLAEIEESPTISNINLRVNNMPQG